MRSSRHSCCMFVVDAPGIPSVLLVYFTGLEYQASEPYVKIERTQAYYRRCNIGNESFGSGVDKKGCKTPYPYHLSSGRQLINWQSRGGRGRSDYSVSISSLSNVLYVFVELDKLKSVRYQLDILG